MCEKMALGGGEEEEIKEILFGVYETAQYNVHAKQQEVVEGALCRILGVMARSGLPD